MAIPTTLIPFDGSLEGQDRDGPLTATGQGALRWTDGTVTTRKMVSPVLAASPTTVEDEQGAITPRLASSITLGSGQYGQTWRMKKADVPSPTLLLSPAESRDHHGDAQLTFSGGAVVVDGKWQLAESTTNHVRDPLAVNGIAYWGAVGSNTEREVIPNGYKQGINSVRYTADGVGSSYQGAAIYTGAITAPAGSTWTAQAWVKVPAGLQIRVLVRENGTNSMYTTSNVSATGEWQFVHHTHTIVADNTTTLHLRIDVDAYTAYSMDVALPQIEEKSYYTPFAHGDMGRGHAWVGTPHASASTRESSMITVGTAGRMSAGAPFEVVVRGRVTNGGMTNNTFVSDGMNWTLRRESGRVGGHPSLLGTVPIPDESDFTASYVSTGSQVHLYANGQHAFTRNVAITELRSSLVLGRLASQDNQQLNGFIESVVIFPRPLTDTERAHLLAMDVWSWDNLNTEDGEVAIGHEATTNLVHNPSFETDASSWDYLISATGQRVTDTSVQGQASLKVTTNGSDGSGVYIYPTGLRPLNYSGPSRMFTGSVWIRGSGTVVVQFQENYASGVANVFTSTQVHLHNGWQRVSVTIATDSSRTLNWIAFLIRQRGTTTSPITFWIDGAQVEEKPYVTPYCDGSLGDGHEWKGTPHLSTSTRTTRGKVSLTKNAVVRYHEDGVTRTTRIEGRTGEIGQFGHYTATDGTLRLRPNSTSVFEVENIILYGRDVTPHEDRLRSLSATWTRQNTSFPQDIPIQKPSSEENTTNLIRNPHLHHLEHVSPSAGTEALETVDVPYGFRTAAIFTGDGVSSFQYLNFGCDPVEPAPLGARTFTASGWVKAEQGVQFGIVLWLRGNRNGVFTNGQKTEWFTGTGSWQHVTNTSTCDPENDLSSPPQVSFATSFINGSPRPSATIRVTGVQLEEKAYATALCPELDEYGNTKAGYAWTGRAHESASRRDGSAMLIDMPPLPTGRGAFYLRYTPMTILQKSQNPHVFYQNGSTDILYRRSSESTYTLRLGNGSTINLAVPEQKRGQTKLIGVEWENGKTRLWVEGLGSVEGECPEDYTLSGRWCFGTTNVYAGDGTYHQFVMFDRPLTETERQKLAASDVWEWDTLFPTMGGMSRVRPQEPLGMIRAAKPIVNKVITSSSGSEE